MSCSAARLTELVHSSSLSSRFGCYVTVGTGQRKADAAGDAVLLSGGGASCLQQENMFGYPVSIPKALSGTPTATCLSLELRLWIRKRKKLQVEASSSGRAMRAAAQRDLNRERTVWSLDPAAGPLRLPPVPAEPPPGQEERGAA